MKCIGKLYLKISIGFTLLKWDVGRIQRNLGIDADPVDYCISKLKQNNSEVSKKGKNYYVEVDGCIITINSSSFTIITAHKN